MRVISNIDVGDNLVSDANASSNGTPWWPRSDGIEVVSTPREFLRWASSRGGKADSQSASQALPAAASMMAGLIDEMNDADDMDVAIGISRGIPAST